MSSEKATMESPVALSAGEKIFTLILVLALVFSLAAIPAFDGHSRITLVSAFRSSIGHS